MVQSLISMELAGVDEVLTPFSKGVSMVVLPWEFPHCISPLGNPMELMHYVFYTLSREA